VDQIKEMLDTLTELSDEQVTELQTAIVGEFETVEKEDPTPQTVDAMTSLADMLDTVRGEVKRREAAAEELTARAAEAATRVKGQDDDNEDEMADGPMADGESDSDDDKDKDESPMPSVEDEEMPKKPMAEASTAQEEGSELSTATENTEAVVETEVAAEAAVVETEPATEATIEAAPATEAAVEEVVVTDTVTETEVAAEAAVEETTADVIVEDAAEAGATYKTDDKEDMKDAEEAEADEEADKADTEASIQETPDALTEQKEQEAPVTAAVSEEAFEAPADRRPAARTSVAPVAITAGADIPGYTAGSTVETMSEVASLMAKRLHGLRRVNGGDGEQHIVASVTTEYPEARTLTQDAESNWAKVSAVTSPEALVASGGHVAPFETKYDIFGLGTTNRPVRDSLARFQADRGGIRFVTPPILSAYGDSVGVWTAANDAAETPSPSAKTSLTVTAAAENSVATDAVTLQMQFGNLATRAYPELIARHNELGLIQHSREAEQYLLGKIASASTAVTSTSLIGFGRDFLVQMGRASAAYRSRHRMEADAPLRAIVPGWVKDAMAADLTLAMPGDSTLNAGSEIDGYVASRNINLTVSLDQNVYGSQGVAALLEFPDSFTWYLFAEGSFLFLDGGTLDLGIIRDSTLTGTNDYKMFVETFEGIAFVGVEALAVTSTISVNGVAAALRDTTGGATAAAIEL
jgi:chemotaxis protein histidine kinase CheA